MTIDNSPPIRDREADRARFPDPAFNCWLDEGISDAGHTVWDQVGSVVDAWHGWENRAFYVKPQEQPSNEALDEAYEQGRAYECRKWDYRVNGLTAERDQYRAMYQSLLKRVADGVSMLPRETLVLQASPLP